ncbi:Eco57I restriction-modification methylase domain-containing protein [Methanocella sp. MCL-LM]|uniref:Eco57I restriction-modification methylase domain-containing protein n=1 Tax=Methanocella sp. MCL-LM TaxID=3412035 RepID=UPI003C72F9F6
MARDRLNGSLTDRYLRLIGTMAAESFGGNMAAARAYADDALVSCLLSNAGFSGAESSTGKSARLESIADLIQSMDDPAEDLCRLLDASRIRIKSQITRDTGVVYTPAAVARFICKRTIEQWLLRQVNRQSDRSWGTLAEILDSGSLTEAGKALEQLNRVSVLDSSCGTGIFLHAATEELARLKEAFGRDGRTGGQVFHETLENNIYGMDIDGNALKAARARLLFSLRKAGCDGWKSTGLRLTKNNVLLPDSASPEDSGFDIIVGNPPYMRVKSMYRGESDSRNRKKVFASDIMKSGLYKLQDGNLNLYKLFIERNLSLLKADGSLGLIIPSSFLNETSSEKLRRHIFDTCSIGEIVEIPEKARAFDRVNQATAIIVLHRGEPGSQFSLRLGADVETLEGESISVNLDELKTLTNSRMEVPLLTAPAIEWTMLKHLRKVPPFKGDGHFAAAGDICVGHLDETIDREFVSEIPTGNMFIKGIHLHEYCVDLSETGASPRWVNKKGLLEKRPSAARVIEQPRIIGRNTINKACRRRLKFALLPPGYVCGNSIKQIVITDPEIQPLYLLGLLNSAVLNWYFEVFCSQNNVRNYSIEALPIPRAPEQVQDAIAYVARKIMETDGKTREYLDRRLMDALVYEIYFTDMHMLSSAVLAAIGEPADAEALIGDDIRRIIEMIESREGFKITQRATYRLT